MKRLGPAPPPTAFRLGWLDGARGLAVILMVGYHFCYDLVWFGHASFDFARHPFWLGARAFIVASFVFIAGFSLVLATRRGLRWATFGRRLAWLTLCAGLVSWGSYLAFPERYIFFGVLHFIAIASILGLGFLRFFWLNAAFAALLLALGLSISHPLFDQAALQWLGLVTKPPATEDYVPLLPWFGIWLGGMFSAQWLHRQGMLKKSSRPSGLGTFLALAGRHSLLIYMLHQPLLIGGFYLITHLTQTAPAYLAGLL